jgi:hypothetical protein
MLIGNLTARITTTTDDLTISEISVPSGWGELARDVNITGKIAQIIIEKD